MNRSEEWLAEYRRRLHAANVASAAVTAATARVAESQKSQGGQVLRKYRNVPTDGYASKREAARGAELELLQQAGAISELRKQHRFELVPSQRDDSGKLIERSVGFYADFTYMENGQLVCEDVKSEATRTPVFVVKKKLMLYVHKIHVREV